jgi:hypothetical protein
MNPHRMTHDDDASESHKGDDGEERGPCRDKCANCQVCDEGQKLKRCGGCGAVLYCSKACQLAHWKRGGHKAVCKAAQAQEMAAVDGGTCGICLGTEPHVIQSGCACRGDAGLAHVSCLAEAATHYVKVATASGSDDEFKRWHTCGICGQKFTGAMMTGLANTWWSKVRGRPREDRERFAASHLLSQALYADGKYVH